MAKKSVTKVKSTKSKPQATAKESLSKKKSTPAKKTSASARQTPRSAKTNTTLSKPAPRSISSSVKNAHAVGSPSSSVKAVIPPSMARHQENDVDLLSEEELRRCKSGLTKKDLEHYRNILLEKRAEILGDVDSLQTDSRNKNESGDHFSPEHMADVGSEYWEQEFNMGLVESEQRLLREIIEALIRIDKGIYGICVQTGEPIGKPRLDAKPWAKFCIAVAREKERRGIKLI